MSRPAGSATTMAIADVSSVPADERQHAEVLVGEERRPDRAEQELGDRHFAEERRRLEQQDDDDADRDENRSRPRRRTAPARSANSTEPPRPPSHAPSRV